MKPIIPVLSSDAARAKYRELLLAEWTRDTLEDVFSLLREEIDDPAPASSQSWWKVLEPREGKVAARDLDPAVIAKIRSFADLFSSGVIPPMPESFSAKRSGKLIDHAEKCWTFLILQALADVRGETGFFADTQSLLFLTALHYLLPQLKEGNLPPEHDCLLNAMHMHLWLVWGLQPSHMLYLWSQLMDYLDRRDLRDHFLFTSFRLTPSADHSYLTKAQQHWSNLLDDGRLQDALDFLFSLHRDSDRGHREEIEQMIRATYRYSEHHPIS